MSNTEFVTESLPLDEVPRRASQYREILKQFAASNDEAWRVKMPWKSSRTVRAVFTAVIQDSPYGGIKTSHDEEWVYLWKEDFTWDIPRP